MMMHGPTTKRTLVGKVGLAAVEVNGDEKVELNE